MDTDNQTSENNNKIRNETERIFNEKLSNPLLKYSKTTTSNTINIGTTKTPKEPITPTSIIKNKYSDEPKEQRSQCRESFRQNRDHSNRNYRARKEYDREHDTSRDSRTRSRDRRSRHRSRSYSNK